MPSNPVFSEPHEKHVFHGGARRVGKGSGDFSCQRERGIDAGGRACRRHADRAGVVHQQGALIEFASIGSGRIVESDNIATVGETANGVGAGGICLVGINYGPSLAYLLAGFDRDAGQGDAVEIGHLAGDLRIARVEYVWRRGKEQHGHHDERQDNTEETLAWLQHDPASLL